MNKIELNVFRVLVLIRGGHTDEVFIDTNLPGSFPKEVDKANLTLRFEVQKGKGIQYVRDNFGIEPEVLDIPGGPI